MIRFRQKEFMGPLLAGALKIANAATVPMMGASMIQAHNQGKEAEKQAEAQKEQLEKQNELIKRQNKQLENLSKKNPEAGSQAAEIVRERTYAIPGSIMNAGQKFMQTEGGKMVKDVGKYAINHKKTLAKTAAWGAGISAAGYGANKLIQRDIKKENLEVTPDGALVPKQKQMSLVPKVITKTAKPLTEPIKKWAIKNPKTSTALKMGGNAIGMGIAFDGAPKVLGYMADKQQAKDQIKATKTFSVLAGLGKTIAKNSRKTIQSIKNAQIIKTPGKTTLGAINQAASFGMFGRKGVADFATKMRNGSSKWSQKLGNSMLAKDKNGVFKVDPSGNFVANKKALVGTAAVGAGLASATYDAAQKGVEKLGRKVDPKAYEYQDSKNQQVI